MTWGSHSTSGSGADRAESLQSRGSDRPSAPPAGPARIDVRDLLRGRHEVILLYKEAEYRLRLTRNDKLILTK